MAEKRSKRKGEKKEKITLDTPVPDMPENVIEFPNQIDLETKLDEIDGKINILKDHIEQTRGEIRNNKLSGIEEAKNPEIKEKVTELRNDIKAIKEQRQVKLNEFNQMRREFYALLDQQKAIRKKVQIRDYKQTLDRIDEIRYQMETGSLSLPEEKKLVTELKNLEISKPYVIQQNERDELIAANKKLQNAKNAEIEVFNKQIKAKGKEIDAIIAQAKERRSEFESTIPQLKEQGKKIEDEVDALYQQKRDLRAQFGQDKKTYYEQQRIIKQREFVLMIHQRIHDAAKKQKEYEERQAEKEKKRQQMLKEKEKRKKDYEERQKRRAEIEAEKKARYEEEKLHPWANEISICQRLISYCEYTTKQQEQAAQEAEVSEAAVEIGKGLVMMAKKSDKDSELISGWTYGAPKKAAKKQRVRKNRPEPTQALQHNLATLNDFAYLQIPVPSGPDDIERTLRMLKEKQEYFENLEEAAQPDLYQGREQPVAKEETLFEDEEGAYPEPSAHTGENKYGVLPEEVEAKYEKGSGQNQRGGRGRGGRGNRGQGRRPRN